MPTYQYVCTDCGEDLEVVQKFSDASLTTHDACGGKLRKVYSPVGIVFKGSGFYRTDSRGSSSVTTSNGSEGKDGKSEKSDKSGAGAETAKTGSTADAGAKKSESTAKSESKSESSKSSSATKVA